MSLLAPALLLVSLMDVQVVVFRHHPGKLDTAERIEARKRDEKAILKAVKDAKISYSYQGGLGSGYELSVRLRDFGAWQKLVAELHKAKSLAYYSTWHKDTKGYGLLLYRQ
jgi:hypothetical protein